LEASRSHGERGARDAGREDRLPTRAPCDASRRASREGSGSSEPLLQIQTNRDLPKRGLSWLVSTHSLWRGYTCRRDELDRANDVVIKLLELIGRYPLLPMRRGTNLVHRVLRYERRIDKKTQHVTGATSLHFASSSDLIEPRH
jgi:hypothetical protein